MMRCQVCLGYHALRRLGSKTSVPCALVLSVPSEAPRLFISLLFQEEDVSLTMCLRCATCSPTRGVVEYDAEGFTKLTLLLMWKDFCFLVHSEYTFAMQICLGIFYCNNQ
ncbi:hypothetical protein A6R68_09671, partial [Neotoma lepida]